jgi:hypothetical protein
VGVSEGVVIQSPTPTPTPTPTPIHREDKCFYLNVKKLLGLSFVPVSEVIKAFELIGNDFDDDADNFLDYFEKTWIGEPKRRGKAYYDSSI